jgi:hypothetical protein
MRELPKQLRSLHIPHNIKNWVQKKYADFLSVSNITGITLSGNHA